MIGHYIAVAFRNFRRHKLNTGIKIVALAMGLTCFISAHLVREFVEGADGQFANSDRTFVIEQAVKRPDRAAVGPFEPFAAAPVAKYLKADFPELEAVARARVYDDTPIKAGENKSYRQVLMVDPAFLRIFNLPFLAGDPEKALETPHSAVLSADAATAIFGTTDVIGRTIRLFSNADVTVTGIVKQFPRPSHITTMYRNSTLDMLVSMDTQDAFGRNMIGSARDDAPEVWGYGAFYITYAVLPADGSLTKADFEHRLASFGARHIPADQGTGQFKAIPVAKVLTALIDSMMLNGGLGIPFTTVLELFGALVLAVACLDFINLATAETFARAKEIGMRKVMGASRLEVAAQTLFEVALLAVIAFGLSFALGVPFGAFIRPELDRGHQHTGARRRLLGLRRGLRDRRLHSGRRLSRAGDGAGKAGRRASLCRQQERVEAVPRGSRRRTVLCREPASGHGRGDGAPDPGGQTSRDQPPAGSLCLHSHQHL